MQQITPPPTIAFVKKSKYRGISVLEALVLTLSAPSHACR